MCPEESPPIKQAKYENENLEKSELTLENFDNEPGFFSSTIKDMLTPGEENKLYTYLKENGLLLENVRCHGSQTMPECMSVMKWTKAKIADKFQWKCEECNNKCSIREDSFFILTKCSLIKTIRIILGWCKDIEPNEIAALLKIQPFHIRKLYETCSEVIEVYVRRNQNLWKLGGENSVVLLDIYPDGCSKFSESQPQIINNNSTKILCLAQTKIIPTQYWFHVLNSQVNSENLMEEIIEVIETMVRPGSVIVTDPNSKILTPDVIKKLDCYLFVSIENLSKHNRPECSIYQILDTIWKPAVEICNEAQNYPPQSVQAYLFDQMWRRKFARTPSEALENFLHHIAQQYPLSQESM